MIKLRTKIEIMLVTAFLINLGIISVLSVNRTISDTQDDVETFIRNSNGNYWNVTGENIQLAIWDLNNTNGGKVLFPSGTYNITKSITPINNLNIIGNGMNSTHWVAGENLNSPILNIGFKLAGAGANDGFQNVLVEGIHFDGNNDSQNQDGVNRNYTWPIVICSDSKYVTIRDCWVNNSCDDGIAIYRRAANTIPPTYITIEDCIITDNERRTGDGYGFKAYTCGIYVAGMYNTIRDNYCENTYAAGIACEDYSANDHVSEYNLIEGNIITGYCTFGLYSEGLGTSNNNTFLNNRVYALEGDGTAYVDYYSTGVLAGGTDDVYRGNTVDGVVEFGMKLLGVRNTIDNNIFRNISGGGLQTQTGGGIKLISPADYNSIIDNTIENFTEYGVDLAASGSNSLIVNNRIYGGERGISASSRNNVTIDVNVIEGQTVNCIMTYSCHGMTITNNRCKGTAEGIQLTGSGSNYNTVTGNNLMGCVTPMEIAANTASCIKNNLGYDYDSLQDDYIWNSNGYYYSVTETGLQDAVDDLTTGGTVWLPECNISVVDIIELDNNTNLIGVGKASQLYLADGSDKNLLQIFEKSNILIENICFEGNNYSQTVYDIGLININDYSAGITEKCENITIRGCYLYNGSKSLIDCEEGTKNIVVEKCYIDGRQHEGYGGGIWFSGNYCIARNNFIKDTYGSGIVVEAQTNQPSSSYHIIDGNIMTGDMAGGVYMEGAAGQDYSKASNCTIINNIIYDINSTAYVVSESYWSIGMIVQENSIVSNNVIDNAQKYGILSKGDNNKFYGNTIKNTQMTGVRIDSNATIFSGNHILDNLGTYALLIEQNDVIVSGNEIINSSGYFIYAYDSVGAKSNLGITNNILKDGNSHGVWVKDYDYVVISDNIIDGVLAARAGIHFEDGSNTTITGNVIKDDAVPYDATDGIDLDVAVDCIVSGNSVSGFTDGIDEHGASDYNIIIGNNFRWNTNGVNVAVNNNNITLNQVP